MAVKLNDTSKGILGKASEKIGNYSEAPGGGTPLAKGQKAPSKQWVDAHRKMQPRDEDGQFTYNSANGKGLKYGPSRGTTVPPFLKGIELTYCAPGTKLKIEGQDGIKIKIMTIDMSVEEIVNNAKYYLESEEGFAGMGKGSSIDKMGRKSKAEKSAKAGQAGFVDPSKLSAGTQKKMDDAKKFYAKNPNPINPQVGGFKVVDDTLNPNGSSTKNTKARYWEYLRGKQQKPTPVPVNSNPNGPNGGGGNGGAGPNNPNQPQQQTPVTPSGKAANPQQGQQMSNALNSLKGILGGFGNTGGNANTNANQTNGPKISLNGFLNKNKKV